MECGNLSFTKVNIFHEVKLSGIYQTEATVELHISWLVVRETFYLMTHFLQRKHLQTVLNPASNKRVNVTGSIDLECKNSPR